MIYFNNSATSYPKPQEVYDAVNQCMQTSPVHASRSGMEEEIEDMDFACRSNLAKLFNAEKPNNIVFTSGSTEALNLAIKGLDLENAHVVTTKIEHNSVIRPLKTMEDQGIIDLTFVDCDKYAYVDPQNIKDAMRADTKLVVVNHCSNVTGTIQDIKAISAIAHEYGAKILIDASQSAGAVPIDVTDWDVDYLAFTGHKSLFGLPGTGGLYMKDELSLEPLKTGGTGVKSEVLVQPKEMTMYYEAGTPNTPGIASLYAGTKFILETGFDVIKDKKQNFVKRMIMALEAVPEITIYNDPEHSSYANFCFNIDGMVPEEVNFALESSYDIHVRSGIHCAPLLLKALGVDPWGTVRASPSYFSTDEQVDEFITAVNEVIAMFVRNRKR